MMHTTVVILVTALIGCVGLIVLTALCGLILSALGIGRNGNAPVETPPLNTGPDSHASALNQSESQAHLYPKWREVFFPKPTHANPTYEITISGIFHNGSSGVDALYYANGGGNFTYKHEALRVNGRPLRGIPHEIIEADRGEHRYCFHLDHPGERLTLAVWPPWRSDWRGSLSAHVRLLPEDAPSVALRQIRRRQQAVREREEAAASAEFAQQIKTLVIRSEAFRNWRDPQYRAQFAQAHIDELIRCQAEIRKEAIDFLQQEQLVRYLRRHHPEVVECFTGRLEALLIAERVQLEKRLAIEAPAPPPTRKRLTAEEVRAIKVRKQQIQDSDRVELKMDKIATRLMIRERLDKLPLDPDEREMLEQELIGEVEEGDADGNVRTL